MPTTAVSTPHGEIHGSAPVRARVPWRQRLFTRQKLWRLAIGVLVSPFALWLLYVVVANAMLSTGLVAKLVSWNPDLANMHYDSASSFWPGVVKIKGFRISGSDSVLEWMVGVDEATADIRMRDLFHHKFTAKHVHGTGYVQRIRLRVDPNDADDPLAQALPPIPERSNPPILEAGPPTELTDENYNLWTAHLEDVDVTIREVWIQQMRFIGEGRVRGGFYMKPLRVIRVGPTVVELTSGEIQVADATVARISSGLIDLTMNTFDPRQVDGLDVFSTAAAHIMLEAQVPGLEFVNKMAPEDGPRFTDGSGDLRTELILNQGELLPGSYFSYKTDNVKVTTPEVIVTGDADVALEAPNDPAERDTTIAVSTRRATIDRLDQKLGPAVVEGFRAFIHTPKQINIAKPLPKAGGSVRVVAAALPDLRWLNGGKQSAERPVFLGGAAFFRGNVDFDAEGRATGALRTLIRKASMKWPHTTATGDATIELDVGSADPFARQASLRKSHIDIKDVVIKHRGETFPSWWAAVDIEEANMAGSSGLAKVTLKCKDAQPAVGLLDGEGVIPGWATGLLTMEGLTASVELRRRGDSIDFSLLHAEGGALDIKGRMLSGGDNPARGAFLVKSGPVLSVGITMGKDGVGIAPLVGESWIKEHTASL